MIALIALLVALWMLMWWYRDRERETQRRYDDCPHPDEMQQTIRVNAILSMNPAVLHRILPGRRWVKKQCRSCGWQRSLYAPSLQKWTDFKAEWDQETIDRNAEYAARERIHEAERSNV